MEAARAAARSLNASSVDGRQRSMTHRRKLLSILAASAVLSCIAALGAMYFATGRYQTAVQDSQIERVGYIINQYVNTTVWRRFATNVGNLARDISQEDN